MVVLDSRPFDEYQRVSIPTAVNVPGAELALRIHDLAPSPQTLVVVNCAGRTRSIIGAQSLINAGVPNKVVALRNGTWAGRSPVLPARAARRGARPAYRPTASPGPSPQPPAWRTASASRASIAARSSAGAPTANVRSTSSTCAIPANTRPGTLQGQS